jgi:hypothetical protein
VRPQLDFTAVLPSKKLRGYVVRLVAKQFEGGDDGKHSGSNGRIRIELPHHRSKDETVLFVGENERR